MLDANLKTQLKTYLEKVSRPIEIVASLDDSAKSQELLALLNDIALRQGRDVVQQRQQFLRLRAVVERSDDLDRAADFFQVRFELGLQIRVEHGYSNSVARWELGALR